MVTDPAGFPGAVPVATILICTFNRCQLLDDTLASLEHLIAPAVSWDILVVDNNSTDATAEVVRKRQTSSPVPLRYVHEARQGKSHALNSGLASTRAAHIVFTDDDVRVEPGWLSAGLAPMLEDEGVAYTGGPVLPIWGAPRPAWLDARRGDLWGAIAILDYGPDAFVFEERQRIPLGANMAVRRTVIEAAGGFNPALGRTGQSLLGQEQAEFFCRTRALGARGVYVPGMVLHHHVPASRLTRRYFRRWWLWKGISRARLYRVHPQAEPGIDLRIARRIANVPRFVWSGVARHAARWVARGLRGQLIEAVRHEMMFAYYLGFAWEEWRNRGSHRP
jgi:glucosyl-dolichyl phosphate glucuronosyltransferase